MNIYERIFLPNERPTLSYMGYEIKGKSYVDDRELALLHACYWMVDNKVTIRKAAENCGFAKSTLHKKIHKELKYLSPDLYQEVIRLMNNNMKRWGGNHKNVK